MNTSDLYQTPQWLFKQLNDEFHFDVDIASNKSNNLCTAETSSNTDGQAEILIHQEFNQWDALDSDWNIYSEDWDGKINTLCYAFCNPPYSGNNKIKFIKKAIDQTAWGVTTVMLLPVAMSTKWVKLIWNHNTHKPHPGIEIRFLPKRVAFINPCTGKIDTSPRNETMIIIFWMK